MRDSDALENNPHVSRSALNDAQAVPGRLELPCRDSIGNRWQAGHCYNFCLNPAMLRRSN